MYMNRAGFGLTTLRSVGPEFVRALKGPGSV